MNLLWIDIETTGLSPVNDRILEVAVAATDEDLNFLDGEAWLVEPGDLFDRLDTLSAAVLDMHDRNGLFSDLLDPAQEKLTLADLETALDTFGRAHKCFQVVGENGPWRSPLCGSSVHFDRSFLRVHTPSFERAVGFRNIDVSTIEMLCDSWFTNGKAPKPDSNHRATDDVLRSIETLKWHRAHHFNAHGRRR